MIVLIIGGTGTLGKNVWPLLLRNPQIERLRILSRGEHVQTEMWEGMTEAERKRIDFFVGDCRDLNRMMKATKDCQIVFHFAAMKSVDKAEYDPNESVKTNIQGTENVIEACLSNHVIRAIFTSTDKAVAPINIYGASKLVAEKLFIQANIGRHRTAFSVCRYGNVFGSNGSVISKWHRAMAEGKPIVLTHREMTRFFITPLKAAEFVVHSAYEMKGGEVFIPKMKSTTMVQMAEAFLDLHTQTFEAEKAHWIGVRPGEKMHEMLISPDEIDLTTDVGDKFIRWPNENLFPILKRGEKISQGFTSHDAERFSMAELKEMICPSV